MSQLKTVITNWVDEAHVTSPVLYNMGHITKTLVIFTTQPGWMIGKAGGLLEKYHKIITEDVPFCRGIHVKIVEAQEYIPYVDKEETHEDSGKILAP